MGKLRTQLKDEMTAAMKSGDKLKLSTMRLLLSELKNEEIKSGEELDDTEVIKVIKRQVKRRLDAREQFEKGGRPELAAKEAKEAVILKAYLPAELNDKEIADIVESALAGLDGSEANNIGKVMSVVMPKIGGRADGRRVNEMVRKRMESI